MAAVIGAAVPLWAWVTGLLVSIALPPVLYWREILQWLAIRFLPDYREARAEIERLKKLSHDPGYEVITWWNESESLFDFNHMLRLRKRFPRQVYSRKTGKVYEIAYPVDTASPRLKK